MKFLQRISPEWSLRLGLGAMYVYSGVDIIRHPTAWHWAVRPLLKWFPASTQAALGQPEVMNRYLISQGVVELVLAFILLAWFLPKFWARWAALITTLEFAAILSLVPIDAIIFRDIGLLGGSLALWIILSRDVFVNPPAVSRSVQNLAEKHEPEGSKKAEHHPPTEFLGRLKHAQETTPRDIKAGKPIVETFEEFMETHSNG